MKLSFPRPRSAIALRDGEKRESRFFFSGFPIRSGMTGKHATSAFSLIELIVVMLIMAILATVVIIKFTGVDSQRNRIAANELRAHLTYIRNMAMNRERTARVEFNTSSDFYKVWIDTTGTFTLAKDPVTQKDWIVEDVALSNVNIGGGNNLYFSATNGAPFYALWSPLTATGTVIFDSAIKVTITPLTGYADVE